MTGSSFSTVSSVEVLDDTTVKINFSQPNPAWAIPFVGLNGMILPQHIFVDYASLRQHRPPPTCSLSARGRTRWSSSAPATSWSMSLT